MIKIEGYQCELCKELFEDELLCRAHEADHIQVDRFRIIDMVHFKTDETFHDNFDNMSGQFPDELITENKEYGGTGALYRLVAVTSIEGIYEASRFEDEWT